MFSITKVRHLRHYLQNGNLIYCSAWTVFIYGLNIWFHIWWTYVIYRNYTYFSYWSFTNCLIWHCNVIYLKKVLQWSRQKHILFNRRIKIIDQYSWWTKSNHYQVVGSRSRALQNEQNKYSIYSLYKTRKDDCKLIFFKKRGTTHFQWPLASNTKLPTQWVLM